MACLDFLIAAMLAFRLFAPAARMFRRGGAAVIACGLLAACAQLPTDVQRPVSTALAAPAGTPLAALVQQRRDAARTRHASGFLLLDKPQSAYGSRLALTQGAQKTLDLQYYAIHADASTERLMAAVRAAAARGVRVRILLDDFHSTGRNADVLALALEQNIEMRLFNPLAGARASPLGRLLGSLDDAQRIQQRMHNKLFIADNVLGVTGGRNLGDAYFGNGKDSNFVDLDVLAAGPIVQDMSRSFDRYWNDRRAYPVRSLVPRKDLEASRERLRERATSEPAPAWEQPPTDLARADFVWAPALLVVDQPGKIALDAPGPDARGSPGVDAARPATLGAAGNAVADGETVVDGLLQLMGQARRELLIIAPYFVPGANMKKAFSDARARGVRIRVLTNSLASNDAPVAHVGYARHREELLATGVELYELRSETASVRSVLAASGGNLSGESRSMLHSKLLVMDGELLVIGSMNLDLRSQLQNTEVALLIRSSGLSDHATRLIETTLRNDAWHVEPSDGGMLWRAPQGSGLADTRREPDASMPLKLLLMMFGPLAPDELL